MRRCGRAAASGRGLPASSCPPQSTNRSLRAPPPRQRRRGLPSGRTRRCPPNNSNDAQEEGKKGKKEKKKTPHQLQVEALTRACDEAERMYRDTRDLNARFSSENEERRLTLAEKRALADEQAELFECSSGRTRERKQRATQLKHEKALLQAQVEQLRLQRERRTELYLENETLEGDLDRAREEARRAQEEKPTTRPSTRSASSRTSRPMPKMPSGRSCLKGSTNILKLPTTT